MPAIDASASAIKESAAPVAIAAERAWSCDEFSRRLEQMGMATSVVGASTGHGRIAKPILVGMAIMATVEVLREMVPEVLARNA